jgi:signal transduction histidine kinase
VEALGPLAAAKSVTLGTECDSLAGPVPCDPALVRQVLSNLVGNAIKFTPEGGAVRVAAATAGDAARVQVIDTGIGIPPEKWAAVFDKFEQLGAGRATGTPLRGSGLGLAISRQIVERHGGTIGVERSEEGVGTTFEFTLPLGPADAAGGPAEDLLRAA